MNEYLTIRIKKKYLMIISLVLVLIFGIGGYYIWSSYHPNIDIQISDGSTGKESIKMQAPHISVVGNGFLALAASVELKLSNIVMQHEQLCQYIKDTYNGANIKLDIEEKDNQTVLKYYGTVATSNNDVVDYHNEIVLDYVLDTNIFKK